MFKRKEEMEGIMKGLSLLQTYIKFSSNKLGLHDVNKACEPFLCELFNILWDKKFKRLEHEERNHPAIDLGDKESGFSIQITSDNTKSKLWDTIDKFEKNKLYKTYPTLIHFIIGEKRYSPSTRDRLQFKKGPKYDVFFADNTAFDYQAQIMDMMDLLLFIDEQDDEVVEKLHEYINNNIQKAIEGYSQQLYDYEPDKLISFTANTFITSFYKINNQIERRALFKDLHKLAIHINKLDKNSRIFLYSALVEGKKDMDRIIIDPYLLKRKLKMRNNNELFAELNILIHEELIDKDSLEGEGILRPNYYDSEGNDLFFDIYRFCLDYKRSLEDLILKADFSQLD